MVLDNVYQFLMDKLGRIVIVRGDTNSFEVVEPNDEKSGKIRLGRLFYANVVEGKIKGSDDDANKILTQGVVANRNGASASNCVEEIFRIMLIDDMKLEIRYLEDIITNSIIIVIDVDGYSRSEKSQIVSDYIIPKLEKCYAASGVSIAIDDEAEDFLLRTYATCVESSMHR